MTAISIVALVCLPAFPGVAPACHLGAANPCPMEKEIAYFKVGNALETGGYIPPSVEITEFLEDLSCPDIASTHLFESEELEYVHSAEFAEAVFAVATGKSRFSPREIPREWLSTAFAWGTHVSASKSMPFRSFDGSAPSTPSLPENRKACSPFLLFRASLEFRSTTGHEEVKLVYPHKVRAAAEDLSKALRKMTAIAGTQIRTADPARGLEANKAGFDPTGRYGESIESAILWISEHMENSVP